MSSWKRVKCIKINKNRSKWSAFWALHYYLLYYTRAHLSLSVRLLCSALSVKTDILLLLILHASIAKITAQLLSLSICVAYLILSDDGMIINQDFCAD